MALTTEKAREMALLSHQPDSARFVRPISTDTEAADADKFRLERLSRVRAQLNRLDKLLADECDPQKLDRLMSALNRLQEAEGWLAGRAKPKPSISTKQKPRSTAQSAPEPQDDPPPTS